MNQAHITNTFGGFFSTNIQNKQTRDEKLHLIRDDDHRRQNYHSQSNMSKTNSGNQRLKGRRNGMYETWNKENDKGK